MDDDENLLMARFEDGFTIHRKPEEKREALPEPEPEYLALPEDTE
jgi:hypothetical protein